MREIKAIIRPGRLSDVLRALHAVPGLPGVTVSRVRGVGKYQPNDGRLSTFDEVEMTKLEIVVPSSAAPGVVGAIERAAHTGQAGDGKIFVLPVEQAVRIRSGDRDDSAL